MQEPFTAGAQRVFDRSREIAGRRGADFVEPVDLLAALIEETESRAAALIQSAGTDLDRIRLEIERVVPGGSENPSATDIGAPPIAESLRTILNTAVASARSAGRGEAAGTEHLLIGLLAADGDVAAILRDVGLEVDTLRDDLIGPLNAEPEPIPLSADLPAPSLFDQTEADDLARIIDASANRAREGLRVIEDYVRFALGDPGLTRRVKDVRHRLGEACRSFDPDWLLGGRDTPGDVGTHVSAFDEGERGDARGVLIANYKRAAEALRSLEEYTKLSDQWIAGRFEGLRYDVYILEKQTLAAVAGRRGLGEARLYVLVGGLPTLGDLTWIVEEAIAGGADAIQYREKGLPDREVLRRARELRIITAKARVPLILNDRPDLARLANADGVHLGQDDVSVRDARRIVGPNALIGVSTHEPSQVEAAIREGANDLGVGPVFPSGTKDFEALAGLAFVQAVAESTQLPWFAIGGIDLGRIDDVIAAGALRVAVSGAILRADRPRDAARALKDRLEETRL